jgi:protein-disulfide isomerase
MKQKTILNIFFQILMLIGFGVSYYLSQHHFEMMEGLGNFKSACNLNDYVNCDAVNSSQFAKLPGGIPLSVVCLGFYLGLLIISFINWIPSVRENWERAIAKTTTSLMALAATFSVIYLMIMIFVIKKLCTFCLAIDAVNTLGLITSWFLYKKSAKNISAQGAWKTLVGICLASIVITTIAIMPTKKSITDQDIKTILANTLHSPQFNVNTAGAPSIGNPQAPVTIVEFSDFQCPFCQRGAKIMNVLLSKFPDKLKIVFKNYPLDMKCNPEIKNPMHTTSCEAALYAICAHEQKLFEPVYETFFENQMDLAPGKPEVLAAQIKGIDSKKLTQCYQSPLTATQLQADIQEGIQFGIQGTPTFFVNGHKIDSLYPIEFWEGLIQELSK